ncbi:hypothetical protein SAZ11_57350 [Streptomyces sp. FXJ1.4098]|nr:hypothetical protein [Streptomyces sp. FXJ1.4098]
MLRHAEHLGYLVAATWPQDRPGGLDFILGKDDLPRVQARATHLANTVPVALNGKVDKRAARPGGRRRGQAGGADWPGCTSERAIEPARGRAGCPFGCDAVETAAGQRERLSARVHYGRMGCGA